MIRATRVLVACGTVVLGGGGASAQTLRPATTLSPAAVAESLAVIGDLDTQLRRASRDAGLWYRRGMVAWAMHERAAEAGAPRELQNRNYARMADSSLRLATEYNADNARYQLAYARFLLSTGNVAMRVVANARFDNVIEAARKGTDSLLWSDAAVEFGRMHWRRYDSYKYRSMRVGEFNMARSISEAVQPTAKAEGELAALAGGGAAAGADAGAGALFSSTPLGTIKNVEELLKRTTMPLPGDVAGGIDYERAASLFREAYEVAPTNARAVRHYAMVLADSNRWRELATFGRTQLAKFPWDPQGWLILGLAEQRLGNPGAALAAFDSAFVFSAPVERARFDRLERVLRPTDSSRVSTASEPVRAATAHFYWRVADPLWSRDGNEVRAEFLARVTFADLRWTVDELGVRGADTERGDAYIRYGPPDLATAVQPRATSEGQDIVTFWVYRSGLVFSFSGMPTWGTARTPFADIGIADASKDAQPVRWDNIATYTIDSMATQIVRFRGGRDSVDILIAAAPPFNAIADASDVRTSVRGYAWLLRGGTVPSFADSVEIAEAGTRAWTARVAPGTYVSRIEASANGSLRAARATTAVVADADPRTGFAPTGFGISDVLVASRADDATPGARWTALRADPVTGPVKRGSEIAVVWENYEFGARDGAARYTVALSLVREQSVAGRIAAGVIGALADAVRIDRQTDRVVVRFDRVTASATAFADHILLGLGETPPGRYTLSLEVTDSISGKKATRAVPLLISQ